MDAEKRTVRFATDNRLCTGCGTCVAACPKRAIAMRESPAGFPRPVIEESQCTHCGLCYDVCSGVHYHFELPADVDGLFLPPLRALYLGRATDPAIHALGQSGGMATALPTCLMGRRDISHALVTRMPADGSLRPQAFFASSPAELLECVGSKYCLNPLNAVLPQWPAEAAGAAMVGLPCHVHGIRNLQHVLPRRWGDAFKLVIGLFCLQAEGYLGIEHLLRHRSQDKPVSRVLYRKKAAAGERGYPCIEYADGTCQDFQEDFIWQFYNDTFAPLRCRFCFDQINRMSDLALGDPNGFSPDVLRQGLNVVAVYTARGEEILERARQDGAVELFPCDREQMRKGQVLLTSRKPRVLSAYSRWKRLGRTVPDVPALRDLPARPERLSMRMFLEYLWKLEAATSRPRAYRKLMRWIAFRGRAAKAKGWLARLLGRGSQ